jgi:VWFA-related protein
MARLHVVFALALVAAQASYAEDQQPPRFQSGVEVVTVDVTVVDGDGRPIHDLQPRDFVVEVDGLRRRVISAQWVALTPATPAAPSVQDAARVAAVREPYSSNATSVPGRFIMRLVDRGNIRFEGMLAHRAAIEGFIDGLQPSDRLSVVASGFGSAPSMPFTTDHERAKRTLTSIVGQRGLDPPSSALKALRELLIELKPIEAPKTIVLISEGFGVPTPDSGEPLIQEIERLAAEARTIVYALQLAPRITDIRRTTQDTKLGPDLTEPVAADRRGAARGQGLPDLGGAQTMPGPANAPVADRAQGGGGLYSVAAATGGSMFTVVMEADPAFARIDSEISDYYLLGVEADPSTRDGKPHGIKVDVDRSGVTVRSRRQLIANRPLPPPRTPEEALVPAFSSPTPIAALPIRVATFSMRGAGEKNIQLMIQAEVGADYAVQKSVVLGFVIADKNDRVVQRRAGNSSLRPIVPGQPSALQFTTSVTLDPGDYTMKLAVADGDRVGSVEHAVHAALGTAGAIAFSDLVVGGTGSAKPAMPPPVGPIIRTDCVQGVVEAYGAAAADVRGRLEIASAADGPASVSAAMAVASGNARAVLTQVLPIQDLAAGRYVLRAVLAAPNPPARTIIRSFEKP